ncbi:GNAT family N-acetyltransferase [Lacticaseibacillus jixiensis]|uniref:GNAT family N-acetyltransferase n=1 Tax=Lacticaseibacillus jixiensis TaxID=3231926 RepID=UPI0036F1B200
MTTIINQRPTTAQLREVISASGLHRPTDSAHLAGMIAGGSEFRLAFADDQIVGVLRALTDYTDVVYIAELAVSADFQHQGIGRALVADLEATLGPKLNYVLLASEVAQDYYQHLGYEPDPRGYFKPAQR